MAKCRTELRLTLQSSGEVSEDYTTNVEVSRAIAEDTPIDSYQFGLLIANVACSVLNDIKGGFDEKSFMEGLTDGCNTFAVHL